MANLGLVITPTARPPRRWERERESVKVREREREALPSEHYPTTTTTTTTTTSTGSSGSREQQIIVDLEIDRNQCLQNSWRWRRRNKEGFTARLLSRHGPETHSAMWVVVGIKQTRRQHWNWSNKGTSVCVCVCVNVCSWIQCPESRLSEKSTALICFLPTCYCRPCHTQSEFHLSVSTPFI